MNRKESINKQVLDFFRTNDLISVKKLEDKLNLPATTIHQALCGSRDIPEKHLFNIIYELVQYGFKLDGYDWTIDDNPDIQHIYGRKFIDMVETIEDNEGGIVYVVKEDRTLACDITDLL